MDVILPPLGYVNEDLCSHNSPYSNRKIQVLKSQLSLFYFGLAKTVLNKYLCMCECFKSPLKGILSMHLLSIISAYEMTVTFCTAAFQKAMFRLGISLELFTVSFIQSRSR